MNLYRHEPRTFRHRLGLALVVLGSAALAVVWVFLVPIYQAPDEPMNLDYALAIYEHGGLFHPTRSSYEELPGHVHPYTHYLMQRTEFGRIVFKPGQRMRPEYGSWDYFARLDRQGPSRAGLVIDTPNKPFAVYPFGYYGLLAAWIRLVHVCVGDGPVVTFFGARLLSVLLLCVSLVTIEATLRRLAFRPSAALTITACIGFFPLTSFVASAVQMDNLSFTLVSLAFYFAVRARQEPASKKLAGLLGLTLGGLLITKIHFFLCVATPIFLMVATELWWTRARLAHWLTTATLLFLPPLATGSLYLWTISGTDVLHFTTPARYENFYSHLAVWFERAFFDYYTGGTHLSFWGVFGWLDAPIYIRGRNTNEFLRVLILFICLAFLALTFWRLEQVGSRLGKLALKKPGVAWRLAVSNPLLNSYFLLTLFMFYLYIRMDNGFGAQGRNWLPVILPIFLTGIVYAPKALTLRASRAALPVATIGGLLLYCTLGGYYALRTIDKRYYGSMPKPVAESKPAPGGEEEAEAPTP